MSLLLHKRRDTLTAYELQKDLISESMVISYLGNLTICGAPQCPFHQDRGAPFVGSPEALQRTADLGQPLRFHMEESRPKYIDLFKIVCLEVAQNCFTYSFQWAGTWIAGSTCFCGCEVKARPEAKKEAAVYGRQKIGPIMKF